MSDAPRRAARSEVDGEAATPRRGRGGTLPAGAQAVLALQSKAGNAAVARAIQRGRVLQRKITIKGGKGAVSYANFAVFQRSDHYRRLIPALIEAHGAKRVEFHLRQMLSAEDADFESEEHFLEALVYDIETKSLAGEEHTLQEQYMTKYGWKKRETDAKGKKPARGGGRGRERAEKPVTGGGGTDAPRPALKVYRTMKMPEWEALERGEHSALGAHLGDFKQAHNYLHRKSPEAKVLVEFTLRPGAERTLFSPGTLALPKKGGPAMPDLIRRTLEGEGVGDAFALASTNEGTAPDRVGIKAEQGEAGFSLGIGGGTSPQVFMKLVAERRVIGRSKPDPRAPREPGDGKPGEPVPEKTGKEGAPDGGTPRGDAEPEPPVPITQTPEFTAFVEALERVPRVVEPVDVRVEGHDPSNQYASVASGSAKGGASSSSSSRPAAYDPSRIGPRRNVGGGDCLFHALAGRNLSAPELRVERQLVAAMREGMPENQVLNAINVAAALSQTDEGLMALIHGRHNVPNDVYALLQAVPGMYAGEDELQQWCIRHNRRVTVIDPGAPLGAGALSVFSPGGRETIPVTEHNLYDVARDWGRRTLMLLKSPAHWELVESIDG